MRTPEESYLNDAYYHNVVDMLVKGILEYEMTPSEVREMAIFACVRAENQKTPQRVFAERVK